jgi:hypothetical protein
VIDLSSLKKEEIGHADDEGQSENEETGSEEEDADHFEEESEQESEYVPVAPIGPVLAISAAERIKLMEERSANSRRERKVRLLDSIPRNPRI